MKHRHLLSLFTLVFFLACGNRKLMLPPSPPEPSVELRGIWVTRFEWVKPEPEAMKQRIQQIMAEASAARFNTVFFQIRGQAETFYPSPFETWSELLPTGDPGFDPLQLAISEAHRNGLAFHAYVNLLTLWNGKEAPRNPQHLYYQHGPEGVAESSWVCFTVDGKPMKLDEYYYLNPVLPAVKSHLKKVIRHLVSNYDIDGLHFDRIRYPGSHYLFDPYSQTAFHADSLKNPQLRAEWARKKLTQLVEDVVAEALLVKPYVQMSCANWGLYRTDDFPGYEKFGSGYGDYYQDAIDWLDRGIMDFLVPMIYWDMTDPRPNLNEVWLDFKKRTPHYRSIFPGLYAKEQWLKNDEIVKQIQFVRQTGGAGYVLFSYSSLEKEIRPFADRVYQKEASLPLFMKRAPAQQAVALQLISSEGKPLQELQVNLTTKKPTTKALLQIPDQDGWCGFILPTKPDSVLLNYDGKNMALSTESWLHPYRYQIQPDGSAQRIHPWLESRDPAADSTDRASIHLLYKSEYPGFAAIQGDSCKIYRTGIFFDKIDLNLGRNRIIASVQTPDSHKVVYGREIYLQPEPAPRLSWPLWIDSTSVQPAANQELLPGDKLIVRFKGAKECDAYAECKPAKLRIELNRTDQQDFSLYEGEFDLTSIPINRPQKITFTLVAKRPEHKKDKITVSAKALLFVRSAHDYPLVRVKKDNSILSYNLGPIRLGGPIVAEYTVGVVLQSNGSSGEFYRIRLANAEEGFIRKNDVEPLPPTALQPNTYLTSVNASPGKGADVVRIPYPQPVPYAVFPEPHFKQIRIRLYGVKTSSTWLTHRNSLQIMENLTWQQIEPDVYQLEVHLKNDKIWGYTFKPNGGALELRLKYPPPLRCKNDSLQLSGLVVAIEAGHGGSSLGAVGLSGLEEKTVNLDVAKRLAALCLSRGIRVVQVRERDNDMGLSDKWQKVEDSDAHLFVSIHANASGSFNGYLGANGTSTYNHNPYWADFADIMYRRLLELPLHGFGRVGSFNYRVTRMCSRPAILVEQAFMSNAEDEEKLFMEDFREQMAEKIMLGIIDYVGYMFDKPVAKK